MCARKLLSFVRVIIFRLGASTRSLARAHTLNVVVVVVGPVVCDVCASSACTCDETGNEEGEYDNVWIRRRNQVPAFSNAVSFSMRKRESKQERGKQEEKSLRLVLMVVLLLVRSIAVLCWSVKILKLYSRHRMGITRFMCQLTFDYPFPTREL